MSRSKHTEAQIMSALKQIEQAAGFFDTVNVRSRQAHERETEGHHSRSYIWNTAQ